MSVFYVRSQSRGPVATGNRRIPTVDLVIDRGYRPASVEDITDEMVEAGAKAFDDLEQAGDDVIAPLLDQDSYEAIVARKILEAVFSR